jgi:superfamily II helicase
MYKILAMADKEPNFGSYACELCHSCLSGERYDYIALDDDDEQTELSICVDCVMDVEGVGDES